MVVIVYRNIIPDAGRTSLYILNILPGLSEADRKESPSQETSKSNIKYPD